METILVTGIPQTEKDDVLEMTLKNAKRFDIEPHYINFDRYLEDSTLSRALGSLRAQKKKLSQKERDRGLVVNATLSIREESGYKTVVNREFFQALEPGLSILLEVKSSHPRIKTWQEINRCYLIPNFSGYLRLVKVNVGNIKKVIKELTDILRNFFSH